MAWCFLREQGLSPIVAAVVVASGLACSSHRQSGNVTPDGGVAFLPSPPGVYVAKVKNLLVGLAPTAAELDAVAADPQALPTLVDAWMALPAYQNKMLRFFQLAFQQTQVTANDFTDQVRAQPGLNDSTTPLLVQNAQESFARTMLELSTRGRPLTDAMTTRTLMMTTALKEFYAFLDTWQVDNDGNIFDAFRTANRFTSIVVQSAGGPVPIEQSLDPTSPNFMHWYNPDVATEETIPECQQDPAVLSAKARSLHYVLWGSIDGRNLANGHFCPGFGGTPRAPQLTAADFEDWTMVTIRAVDQGQPTTPFYDLPALRTARELVLSVPRVGFFSTPAFFANWQTNSSNQMRVTMHQTLIVATGATVEVGDDSSLAATPGLDAPHASAGPCYACHRTLDPTRSILSATWSWNYHSQLDPIWIGQPGLFAFRGVVKPVSSIGDLGDALAQHPLVAAGWVQKLCHYVNSVACDEGDPEFQRLVAQFRDSNYQWTALVKALVTSPLTTHAAATTTAERNGGEIVAVARRDHLCAALNARLGFTDVCGLNPRRGPARTPAMAAISQIVSGLPSDAYGRGAVAPILPNEPNVLFLAGVRNICEAVAASVVDAEVDVDVPPPPSTVKQWSSAQPDAAIGDFVTTLMALGPSDPRTAPATTLLKEHFTAALAQPGTTPTDALRSTFAVACQAPSLISVGL